MFLKTSEYKELAKKISKNLETRAFINGNYVESSDGKKFRTINPATEEVITEVTSCCEKDVETAVNAAKASFESRVWAKDPNFRKEVLLKFAELFEEKAQEFAILETLDSGKPIFDTIQTDLPETIECFRFHAEAIDKIQDEITPSDDNTLNIVVREPIGVVAAILPWNFPLQMAAWKLAPILAAGNSVLVKPSKLTSLTLIKLAALFKEAGVPDGVINVLPGSGSVVGNYLAMHNEVSLLTFTGSTSVGKSLLECAGRSNAKRILLEMGGKSPTIVMPDIDDFDYVADQIAAATLWNMGENCTQNSRVLIHEDIKEKLTQCILDKVESWTIGDPLNPENQLGALIEEKHMNEVLKYVEIGKNEGGKLLSGGERILTETGGYFVKPAVFDEVTPDMTIAREEIFGPVFAIMTFEDIDEVIKIANDTEYGLHASVYTNDMHIAHRLTRDIKAGVISVNSFTEGAANTPFGGYKQSGFFGRDKSVWANKQYTETKTICMTFK